MIRTHAPAASVALCALCMLCASCGGTTPRTTEHDGGAPFAGRTIVVSDSLLRTGGTDTIRFGRLHPGETGLQRLQFENAATHPLTIVSLTRSCGCTTLEYDAEPVVPGRSLRTTLFFDTRGQQGWQLKSLDIAFAGAARPLRLLVEAEVE